MQQLEVIVDNYLRLDDSQLSEDIKAMLWQALLVYNPQNPSEYVELLRRDHLGQLLIPRGFALKLRKGLAHYGIEVVWNDQRVRVPAPIPEPLPAIEYLGYQHRAFDRLSRAEQGIYEGPTASGKTITAAILTSVIQQRTLVIVNKINLATQWQDRFRTALGIECGIIGDQGWWEADVTIALRQSLWRARGRLEQDGWFRRWGCLMYDECHEVPSAESARELVQLFPAYFRYGFSATPDRHSWLEGASRGILGEIVCRTTEQELIDAGRLVKPKVVVVRTPFQFKWNPHRNTHTEYQRCLKKLKADPARNEQIRKVMSGLRGQTVLVQSDHKTHLNELHAIALAAGWPDERINYFTSDQNDDERQEIMRLCEGGDRMVLTTIGKEAMDIPRLNRYMNVFPGKNEANTRQMVGRLKRVHASKVDDPPIFYDFFDHRVSRLVRQFQQRYAVYMADGLDVMIVGDVPVSAAPH